MSGSIHGGPPPLAPRSHRYRDGVILAFSAAVLIATAGARLSSERAPAATQAAASSEEPPPLPPPLPTGAASSAVSVSFDDALAGCNFTDRGFGDYERWRPLPLGKVLIPRAGAVGPDGGYDLLVHFHGSDAVRKQLAPEGLDLVIAGIDVGLMSGSYTKALAGPEVWRAVHASITQEVARASGYREAHIRNLALSSWSAGYGAIAQILAQDRRREPLPLNAVVLLDSLHAGYAGYANGKGRLESGQLSAFVEAARAAARGGPLFYLTHTEIPTSGYASTSETAAFLLGQIEVTEKTVEPDPESPIRLTKMLDEGRLFVRGYGGATKEDHCAQLRLLPSILFEHVLPAFKP